MIALSESVKTLLVLMTPMAPHIACELWEVISRGTGVVVQQGDGKESAMTSSGTQYNTSLNALQQSWPVACVCE